MSLDRPLGMLGFLEKSTLISCLESEGPGGGVLEAKGGKNVCLADGVCFQCTLASDVFGVHPEDPVLSFLENNLQSFPRAGEEWLPSYAKGEK